MLKYLILFVLLTVEAINIGNFVISNNKGIRSDLANSAALIISSKQPSKMRCLVAGNITWSLTVVYDDTSTAINNCFLCNRYFTSNETIALTGFQLFEKKCKKRIIIFFVTNLDVLV